MMFLVVVQGATDREGVTDEAAVLTYSSYQVERVLVKDGTDESREPKESIMSISAKEQVVKQVKENPDRSCRSHRS